MLLITIAIDKITNGYKPDRKLVAAAAAVDLLNAGLGAAVATAFLL